MSNINAEILPKRFQLFSELVPSGAVIGWMFGPEGPTTDGNARTREAEATARTLGRKIVAVTATSESEIDLAFDALVQQRVNALFIHASPFLNTRNNQIVRLAARHRIATSHEFAESVAAGGLMSYGSSATDQSRQIGIYVGRILKGAKPAELPVLQPTRFEFVINLRTARTLGLDVPAKLLALTDEVIE